VLSLATGDAPEIDHEEVLWNLTTSLITMLDEVEKETRGRMKRGLSTDDLLTNEVVEAVNTLMTLRHIVREVARRHEVRTMVKALFTSKDFNQLVEDIDVVRLLLSSVLVIVILAASSLFFVHSDSASTTSATGRQRWYRC
jgi:hypothetical protein